MVRRQANSSFAPLARRRADLVSAHFGIICAASGSAPAGARLGFAVPKRLLPRAVDRNAVKRVAREAWRLAAWGTRERPAVAMIRLHRLDAAWKSMPAATRKKAWRAELDALVARLLRGGAVRQSGGPSPGVQS